MRAAVARQEGITVEDIDEPTPGSGHVVVKPLACGICGSDLHAAKDLRHFCELTTSVGGLQPGLDPEAGIVFGHEYVAEILDHGPDTMKTLPVGTHVCAVPILVGSTGVQSIGFSNQVPGALADQMLLQEMLLLPVPEGVAPERAALTEPLAVGEHAVASAGLQGDEACLVIGCGPVGLAVVMALKERGAGPIIAADFAPGRRHLAERLGADQVVDPAEVSPYSKWSEVGVPANGMERMAADMMGGTAKDAVIFEAVGVPGIIQQIIEGAPPKARVVVVGVCMETDYQEPFLAITKELSIRYVFGYSPDEYAATLQRLATTLLPVDELVTDILTLDQTADAFQTLASPGDHGKILIRH